MNKKKIIATISVLISLIIADIIWFVISLDRLYRPIMGDLLAPNPNLWAAAGFYIIYAIGLCYFVVFPSLENNGSTRKLIISSGLFGLVAYCTYDLTALAVINNFDAKLAFIDICWGICAAIFTCLSAQFITKKLIK